MQDLETIVVEQAHTIDDLTKENARYKQATREARDLLTTALLALDNSDYHVANEHMERASDRLYSVKAATCDCGDLTCDCGCIPGNYPCEHGSAGAGCGS